MVYLPHDILVLISEYLPNSNMSTINVVDKHWHQSLERITNERKKLDLVVDGTIDHYSNGYSGNLNVRLLGMVNNYGINFHTIYVNEDYCVVASDDKVIGTMINYGGDNEYEWRDGIDLHFFKLYYDYTPGGIIYENHSSIIELAKKGIWNDRIRHITHEIKGTNGKEMHGSNTYAILSDGTILSEYRGRIEFTIGISHVSLIGSGDDSILYYNTPVGNIVVHKEYFHVEGSLIKVYPTSPSQVKRGGLYLYSDIGIYYDVNDNGLYLTDVNVIYTTEQ